MPSGQQEAVVAPPLKDPTIMNPAASSDHKAERFYGAARLCGSGGAVAFQDGSVWRERELYVRAIELNPSFAAAYHNLALALGEGEVVDIGGEEWDQRRLYVKAIEHEPSFAPAYVNLAGLLGPEDRVTVGSQPPVDRCALLLQAIHVDPRCAMAYVNLGILLPPQSVVQLPQGGVLSAAGLMATARSLDPSVAPPPSPGVVASTPRGAVLLGSRGAAAPPSPVMVSPQKLVPVVPGSPAGTQQVLLCQAAPLPALLGSSGGGLSVGSAAPLKAPATSSASLGSGALAGGQ